MEQKLRFELVLGRLVGSPEIFDPGHKVFTFLGNFLQVKKPRIVDLKFKYKF
jgi:hypothetical protein